MTKFYCAGCGRHFNLYVNEASTREFTHLWEAEHANCEPAYHAALALVDYLEPEDIDRSWKVGGRWYHGLADVLGALQNG